MTSSDQPGGPTEPSVPGADSGWQPPNVSDPAWTPSAPGQPGSVTPGLGTSGYYTPDPNAPIVGQQQYSEYPEGYAPMGQVPPPGFPTASQYPGFPGYATGAPGQPAPNNSMAIASLVVSLVSLPGFLCYGAGLVGAILAIVLGVVAKRQISQSGEQGSGMALAGIIIGAVGVAIGLVGLIALAIFLTAFCSEGYC